MTDSHHRWHEAPDAAALARQLAQRVARQLQDGLKQRGQALLVVSGGSTPVPFFQDLARCELDWGHVHLTLADERWLPPDHEDSNERLVRAHLLAGPASQARFVPLKTADVRAAQGVASVEAALEALPWPADAVVLGMGADAHTASLFPNSPQLPQALDENRTARCLAVDAPPAPNVPVNRISLSRRALLETRFLALHLTGAAKRKTLDNALEPGPVNAMPIRLAWQQHRVLCEIYYSS